jgi:transcriptional regulator with XRE-family HTH domain
MEEREVKNQALGEVVRARRVSRGMSLADAAAASGLHHSYWSKLENGHYQTPSPRHLQTIAATLELPIEDLYGLAGYAVSDKLPSFKPYLRAKYDLPPEAVSDLERYFDLLRNYYGIPKDYPVFPPKTKNSTSTDNSATQAPAKEDRRAS